MAVDPPKLRLPPYTALRAFEAAARHNSFVAAARELCVTPAAVAQQVKALESWLGGALFERHSQGIALTPQGRHARPALSAAMDQMGLAVQNLRSEMRGSELHIAALPALAQLWLSPRLRRLRQDFPGVQISVTAMEEPPNFKREPFDMGLFYLDAPRKDVRTVALAKDHLLPVCTPKILKTLRVKGKIRLHGHPLLHDTVWDDDWARWLDATSMHEVDATTGPRFSLYSMALQAALDSEGLLMGRECLVAPYLTSGKLRAASPIRVPLPTGPNLLLPAHRADHKLTQQIANWIQMSFSDAASTLSRSLS
ncbi:glycine cleavage system transcriptional activator [mine drainage metagenome]|uniref:Glycine cleavage system transcriptional activator n=1 Tax=mine drainage metagenome TaxID=410659 RepID=A0A1J5RVV7_9ZZZZ